MATTTTDRLSVDKDNPETETMAAIPDDEEVVPQGEHSQETRKTLPHKILRIIWDSLDKSPEERKFINKADWWIMSYVCVAYFVKYLDQTNVINAYVSGMKEDLNMDAHDDQDSAIHLAPITGAGLGYSRNGHGGREKR
ncbi:hypothetical protein NM208_g13660 [Fusarium decemcellulare]|uniref:Uncharacterized protein n=1 Tax=Fusarium decemcellulare TaxID=57161 RepID=A0ACC1RLK1_9HYPO|nr:hypothetical protein NM208_g13660 [Fusarium decemcellulare]